MAAPSRRDFLRTLGAGATAGAAAPLLGPGCGDNLAGPSADLGVAVLEPSSDALLVSVWAKGAREAAIELRAGDTVRSAVVPIGPSGTGAFDARGLTPGTLYEIAVSAGGAQLPPCYAATAPRDDDPRPVRIAVVADVDTDPAFDTDLAAHLVDARPDLLVTIGDFPYTDNGPPATDVLTYRERHAALRTLPKVRALLQAMPVRAIYDDHEFRNDWDAHFVETEGARYAAAMAVWDEFFPVRDAAGEIRYRSWRWGAHAECFLLDCRRFRSSNADPDGPAKTMLGAAQRAWLIGALARSTATFKLVFTSVPLDFGVGNDYWIAFQTERRAIFEAVIGLPGVVFLSADQHWFAAHRHAHGIREFQVGPFSRGIRTPPAAAPGVLFRALAYNAGLIDITADHLTVAGLGSDGVLLYEERLTPEELTPRAT